MIDIVGLESIGKYIIWLWSKYVKTKTYTLYGP